MGVALAVLIAATTVTLALTGGFNRRLVTVKTGEIVMCTAGEMLEDNTKSVEVPVSEVGKYSVSTRVITCPDHQNVGALYNEAQKAIAAGDLRAASAKLKQVVAANPTYKKAADQLKEIASGKKPSPDTGSSASGESTASPAPDEPATAVSSLTKYVPDRIKGFSAQGVIADPESITRNYIPASGRADLLVVMAEQTVDAGSAAKTIAVLRATYASSPANVAVNAKTKGYFGVRGQSAAVIFADGPVVVTVEMHAKQGGASALKEALLEVARTIQGG